MSELPESSPAPSGNSHRPIIMEAILATLLGHVILLLAFTPEPAHRTRTPQRTATISLCNFGSMPRERAALMEKWMAVHDPSCIARSDTAASPTVRLPQARRPTPADLPRPEFEEILPARAAESPEYIVVQQAPGVPLYRHAPYALRIPAAAPKFPPQVTRDGRAVSLSLPPEAAKLGGSVPPASTHLLLRREAGTDQIRFTVLRSCGDAGLDLLTARFLVGEADRLKIGAEPTSFVVHWNPSSGERP